MDIIGKSLQIKEVIEIADKVAITDASVLITGESGTGKELIAKRIQLKSTRNDKHFIKINCGAFTETLLESELFGHEKGAFTGAYKLKKGIFERANQGTVFLDEISNAPITMQKRLLRVLQDGEFNHVGGSQLIKSEFRLITATNANIKDLVKESRFMPDLFSRIAVIIIHVPPLRNRKNDIPLLVDYYLNKSAKIVNKTFRNKLIKYSENYDWPLNVREMENYIQRALALDNPDCLDDNSDMFFNNHNNYLLDSENYQFSNCQGNNVKILETCIHEIIDKAKKDNMHPDDKLSRLNLQNIFKCSKDKLIRTVNASQGRLDFFVRKNGKLIPQKTKNCFIYPTLRQNCDANAS